MLVGFSESHYMVSRIMNNLVICTVNLNYGQYYPLILKCLESFAFMTDWFQDITVLGTLGVRLHRLVDRWLNFSTVNVLYIKCILNCLREVRIGFLPARSPLAYQPLQSCTQANFSVEMTVHKCNYLPFKNLCMHNVFYMSTMKTQSIVSIFSMLL